MGQHQIQKQILKNFSFEGRQLNSREVWCLKDNSLRPISRSISSVGFFEVDCSKAVDEYIRILENKFKESLCRFGQGHFSRTDVGRETYDFIAMHYVRSQAYRIQVKHVVDECRRNSRLTKQQARAEYDRLTSHQEVAVFSDLVDSVSRTLTHYVMYPVMMTGSLSFVTSDKILYAGTIESGQRETFVWFPLSPTTGLCLKSEGYAGQILGPVVEVNRTLGRISFAKSFEAPLLQCQKPQPQEGRPESFNALNGLMLPGSTELFAFNCEALDSTLRSAEHSTGYLYEPPADCSLNNVANPIPRRVERNRTLAGDE